MSKSKEIGWSWPQRGLGHEKVRSALKLASLYYEDPPPACYPGTSLSEVLGPDGLALAAEVIGAQNNMIGTHTHGRWGDDGEWKKDDGEGGFDGPQMIEAQAIWMIASMVGGKPETVDGLFCGGGTEANLQGLWIGREWLAREVGDESRSVLVTTPLVHYSIYKAAEILGFGKIRWSQCLECGIAHLLDSTSPVVHVGLNDRYQMDVSDLVACCRAQYSAGRRAFLIVATVATTAMGSVDPIVEISEAIDRMKDELAGAAFYLHVDASFGGFTVPFMNRHAKIGFENRHVQSITFDADKMGRLPYPAGVSIYRKGLSELIAREIAYVRGHNDDCVSGSRSALPSTLAWYLYQRDGIKGQQEYVRACIKARDKLARDLSKRFPARSNWNELVVYPHDPRVNILPVVIHKRGAELKVREDLEDGVLKPLQLRFDYVPVPHDRRACPVRVYKICVMPHMLKSGVLDQLVEALATVLR